MRSFKEYEQSPSRLKQPRRSQRHAVTCCTKVCNFFSSFWLQLFNIVDLVVGSILLAFGIFVKFLVPKDGNISEHQVLFWVSLMAFILGSLFILVALFSFCGIVSNSCRFAVVPSGYLALVLALVSVGAGTAGYLCDEEILSYIDSNQQKFNMRTEHVEYVHVFYDIIVITLFASFVIEMSRFMLSSQFTSTSNLIDGPGGDLEISESLLRDSERSSYQSSDRERGYRDERDSRYRNYSGTSGGSGRGRYNDSGYQYHDEERGYRYPQSYYREPQHHYDYNSRPL